MVLPNLHSYPASPVHGQCLASTPASSTPTLDVAFDRQEQPLPPLWPHRLSMSFSAMADQIAAVSQALALVPPTAFSGTDVGAEVGALRARLDGIELTQGRLAAELETLKTQLVVAAEGEGEGGKAPDVATQAAKIEALEKKLEELSAAVRLDQDRLPARLHNAAATVMKASLKAPVTASSKPVAGFPTTRGEFEHITKERYEALLKAYGLSLKGDTAAKRETLRTFAGIPQDGQ